MPARHIKRTSGSPARSGGSGGMLALLGGLVCIALGVGIGYLAFSGSQKTSNDKNGDEALVSKKEKMKFADEKYKEGVEKGREIEKEKLPLIIKDAVIKAQAELDAKHKQEIERLNNRIARIESDAETDTQKIVDEATAKAKEESAIEINDLKQKIAEIQSAPPVPMVVVVSAGALTVVNTNAKEKISEIKITVARPNGEAYTCYVNNIAPGKFATFKASSLIFQDKSIGAVREADKLKFTIKYMYGTGEFRETSVEPIFEQ